MARMRRQPAARPVQLSVLLPTHRHDLMAISRIAQACSWAGPGIEIIVRDNSGNAGKREQIARFRRDNCTIVSVDPCQPLENFSELMRLAKGDFIFCIGDDDLCFDRAMAALPAVIDEFGKDLSVAGMTGAYALETSKGSAVVAYKDIESDSVTARVAGYLSFGHANVMVYSPQRRAMVERVFHFMRAMPCYLSYHDQITCLLYLLNGRFVRLQRLIYAYDVGPWEEPQSAQKRDIDFYSAAGFDPAINKLHWFLCGFEGAMLIRNSGIFPDYPPPQRQKMADQWFSAMFIRFTNNPRLTFDSAFAGQAEAFCQKLRASKGSLPFPDMLADICTFMAIFSEAKAQSYFDFWKELLNRRNPVAAAAER